jgi:drug/metabolite transporter (DMT)-like permease
MGIGIKIPVKYSIRCDKVGNIDQGYFFVKDSFLNLSYQNMLQFKTFLKIFMLIYYIFKPKLNNMKGIGIVIIIIGIIMLIWTGFSYTKKEKVVDLGPLEINADKEKQVNWPSYAGGILVIGGVIILLLDKRK